MRNAPHYTRASEKDYWRTIPLEQLRRMLRAERKRGVDGHWAYDLPRHDAMIRVYRERTRRDVSALPEPHQDKPRSAQT